MIYINEYKINLTPSFQIELENAYRYIAIKLKEPITAKGFYEKIIKQIYSLQYFPERYVKIHNYEDKNRNLRKILIGKYIIIYEVNKIYMEVSILHIFHGTQNYLNKL